MSASMMLLCAADRLSDVCWACDAADAARFACAPSVDRSDDAAWIAESMLLSALAADDGVERSRPLTPSAPALASPVFSVRRSLPGTLPVPTWKVRLALPL